MFKTFLPIIAGIAFALNWAAPVTAMDFPSVLDCEELAGSPYDPLIDAGLGVELDKLNTADAIATCEAALTDSPDNPRVLFHLGRAHDAAGDFEQAIKYYRAAVKVGSDLAAVSLAELYEYGFGLDPDVDQAKRYYQLAFDRSGLPIAAGNLGYFYDHGIGVEADKTKAAEYYTIASDAGIVWAKVSLGFLYENGQGVEQDSEMAVALYQQAAEAGDADALNNLGAAHESGIGGLEKSIKQAIKYYERAIEGGSGMAAANLGDIFATGRAGVPINTEKATQYYEMAIERGPEDITARAQNSFAWHLATIKGDLARAEELATASLELNDKDPATLDTMGWIKHLQGDNAAAHVYLQAAINAGGNTTHYAHFGAVQVAVGNTQAAREAYEKAIALAPDDYDEPTVDLTAIAEWLANN